MSLDTSPRRLCAIAAATLILPAVCQAGPVAAEHYPPAVNNEGEALAGMNIRLGRLAAQTFTSTAAGAITTVELPIWHWAGEGFPPSADLTVEIWGVNGLGEPDSGNILGSRTLTPGEIPGEIFTVSLTSIDFSADAINLAVGDELAIVAISATTGVLAEYGWSGDFDGNPYGGGAQFLNDDDAGWIQPNTQTGDLAFRVNVVPTPGAMMTMGLGGLIALRRRRA